MSRLGKWFLSLTMVSSILPLSVVGAETNGDLDTSYSASANYSVCNDLPTIKAGFDYNIALKTDGTVWAWGRNKEGQLGDGSGGSSSTVSKIDALSNIEGIAAGYAHALAVDENHHVYAWGINDAGQLGDGSTSQGNTPKEVKGLDDVYTVAAGKKHSLAIDKKGNVWAWGDNSYGQLGDGSDKSRTSPAKLKSISEVKAISASEMFSAAVKEDGSVWTWGFNGEGTLGTGKDSDSLVPVKVKGLENAVDIATGWRHTIALRSNGTVWAWGRNTEGQLGNGTNTSSNVPVQVQGLTNVVAIAAGNSSSYAVKNDGTVWAWGQNLNGKLGDGTESKQNTPVKVLGPNGSSALDHIFSITSGNDHAIAVDEDGVAWAWGGNGVGQLGDGSTSNAPTPIKVNHDFVIKHHLKSLTLSAGILTPAFCGKVKQYEARVRNEVDSLTLKPKAVDSNAAIIISINDKPAGSVASTETSEPLPLVVGENRIEIKVQMLDGATIYKLKVTRDKEGKPSEGNNLTVSEKNLLLQVKKTANLKVYVTEKSGNLLDVTNDKKTSFEVSDPQIVTVAKGKVKAGTQEGEATITVTYKNDKLVVPVKVSNIGVSKLIIADKNIEMKKEETKQLELSARMTNKETNQVTELATWTSDNPKVVAVEDGKLKALKEGKAKIKVIYGGKSVTIMVTVKK
ncbi:Ig-like domain-containing protein [Brevibacillus ginsengisoli]|uniref:RCC1 domain-containing protein n=1 Tax=Brevibacillus ginsengisoli TaxID=363854 RepID=UPI003CE9CFB7